MSEEPLLRPEEVASVLSSDQTQDASGPEKTGPSAYSLREPVVLPPDREPAAREILERYTELFAEALRAAFEAEISLALDGFQQQRAAAALGVLQEPAWVLPFLDGERGRLALALSPQLALILMELALGGVGAAPSEGREPTPLERRVVSRLQDRLCLAAKGQSDTLRPGAAGFGIVPSDFAPAGETVGVGLLKVKAAGADHNALILANGPLLAPDMEDEAEVPDRPGPLAPRLERVPLTVRPVLAAGRLAMKDLLEMKEGAVLRLDVREDAMLELRVVGEALFRGRIVRLEGNPGFSVVSRKGSPPRREEEEETS